MKIEIRLEQKNDYRTVEELTREAFWNVHVPGCDEHLLVHKLRSCPAFIPELDFVALRDNQIVGNIMYSTAKVIGEANNEHQVISFGPVSVLPAFQKQGIGAALIEHSKKAATAMGLNAIIIYGNPAYYHRFGFKSASQYRIGRSDGKYAKALMALELCEGAFNGIQGRFFEDPVFSVSKEELAQFEKSFPPKEKHITASQQEFEIIANSFE